MMTVVTTVTLKDETRSKWDRVMHERVRAASDMDGWVAVQLVREVDEPRRRAIIGTWLELGEPLPEAEGVTATPGCTR